MSQPISYIISEQDFDLSLIPKAGRTRGTDAFRKHVTKYFRKQYEGQGGDTTVEFVDGNINVTWMPVEADQEPMDAIIDLLSAGDYATAAPMLQSLLQVNPRDHDALYNLGMVYSDQGRLDEAQDLLRRATEVSPNNANSWVALGVAALRAKDPEVARPALEKAIGINPRNPYAVRTLGTLQMMVGDYATAIKTLRTAQKLAPEDPIILLNLAQALLADDPDGHSAEADSLLTRVLQLAPHGDTAEKAKTARSAIANRRFRANAVEDLRPDAMFYCLGALERFEGMSPGELAPIVLEMAVLGESGLNVNDPEQRYTLKLTPGEFSGLQIVCMMQVGLTILDPNMNTGMDLDKEYAAALALHTRKPGRSAAGNPRPSSA